MNREKKIKVFMNNALIGEYRFMDICRIAKGAAGSHSIQFVGETVCFIG